MDPIRPIGPRDVELERIYRVERTAEEERRRQGDDERRRRRRDAESQGGDEPPEDDGHAIDIRV